jgi:hypothetical protein
MIATHPQTYIEEKNSLQYYDTLQNKSIPEKLNIYKPQLVQNIFLKKYFVLSSLGSVIEKSKYIIDLQDDWDDEGSIGYKEETWRKSVDFLIEYVEWVYSKFNKFYIPSIYHGQKGGIDIVWQEATFKMLIRLDEKVENAVFYAEDKKRVQNSQGEFKVANLNYFMLPIPIEY